LVHNTFKYESAKGDFNCVILDPYVMHDTPLLDGQFGDTSYKQSQTSCALLVYDYHQNTNRFTNAFNYLAMLYRFEN